MIEGRNQPTGAGCVWVVIFMLLIIGAVCIYNKIWLGWLLMGIGVLLIFGLWRREI